MKSRRWWLASRSTVPIVTIQGNVSSTSTTQYYPFTKLETDKTIDPEDVRLPMIAYEKLNHQSQSLYTDIESMVCNILPFFDAQTNRKAFYLDISEALKGVRLKNDYSNQLVQELAKGANSVLTKTPDYPLQLKKFTNLLLTDYFTMYLVIKSTVESLDPEIVARKISDHKLNDLYEDFKKFVLKSQLVTVNHEMDIYPNLDIEEIAPRVENLEKKLKTILVAMYLEV